jgi:hypothetical protein
MRVSPIEINHQNKAKRTRRNEGETKDQDMRKVGSQNTSNRKQYGSKRRNSDSKKTQLSTKELALMARVLLGAGFGLGCICDLLSVHWWLCLCYEQVRLFLPIRPAPGLQNVWRKCLAGAGRRDVGNRSSLGPDNFELEGLAETVGERRGPVFDPEPNRITGSDQGLLTTTHRSAHNVIS